MAPASIDPSIVVDRNLALELVRVTEAAALAASRWIGRGDKNAADGAAVEAMRRAFDTVAISGTVVIGEGEKDEAPMLYIARRSGLRHGRGGRGGHRGRSAGGPPPTPRRAAPTPRHRGAGGEAASCRARHLLGQIAVGPARTARASRRPADNLRELA